MATSSEPSHILGDWQQTICKEKKFLKALTFFDVNSSIPNCKVCNLFSIKDKNKLKKPN